MSFMALRLWWAEALLELNEWSRRAIIIWAACLVATLLLCGLAFWSKASTQSLWQSQQVVNATQALATSPSVALADADNADVNADIQVLKDTQNPPPVELNNGALERLSNASLALHSHLQQLYGDDATPTANASRIAGVVVAMRQGQIVNVAGDFWQTVLETLTDLELAVDSGTINDNSSVELVANVRASYETLRRNDAAESANERVKQHAGAPLPWVLRALPWFALLLPLACLFYGLRSLRQRISRRHEQYPQASYRQVADAHHTERLTSTNPPGNPHVAERRTQAAILQLLDEMEPLADGDLTHEASVSEDVTGALADAFNQAVHELRRLVQQINTSSENVSKAVSESRDRTLIMAKQGASQARQVSKTHERLEQMQKDVQALALTSQQVAAYAIDVAQRTQQAAKAVARTHDSLATMRNQADVAERSISRLVGSTQSIDTRLSDIQAAANRTELLALNSTIKAAARRQTASVFEGDFDDTMANHNANHFAELASDVSALANVLGTATRDIDQLADVIRDEASDSLNAMHATVKQVDISEQMSVVARNHLTEIATAAEALGSAVNEVAQRTEEQAAGVTEVTKAAAVINDITHESATSLTQAVKDLQSLDDLSNTLSASVHGFRLPPVADT